MNQFPLYYSSNIPTLSINMQNINRPHQVSAEFRLPAKLLANLIDIEANYSTQTNPVSVAFCLTPNQLDILLTYFITGKNIHCPFARLSLKPTFLAPNNPLTDFQLNIFSPFFYHSCSYNAIEIIQNSNSYTKLEFKLSITEENYFKTAYITQKISFLNSVFWSTGPVECELQQPNQIDSIKIYSVKQMQHLTDQLNPLRVNHE